MGGGVTKSGETLLMRLRRVEFNPCMRQRGADVATSKKFILANENNMLYDIPYTCRIQQRAHNDKRGPLHHTVTSIAAAVYAPREQMSHVVAGPAPSVQQTFMAAGHSQRGVVVKVVLIKGENQRAHCPSLSLAGSRC